jgi:hypothetical protein
MGICGSRSSLKKRDTARETKKCKWLKEDERGKSQ